jgi:flagellar biosynthesis anti-sigma factor FlgM
MKVNEYITQTQTKAITNETQTLGRENRAKGQADQQPVETQTGDRVHLSDRSKEIARAQDISNQAPDVRTEKVEDIKARIKAGTYNVSAVLVADAMLKSTISETV